MYPKAFPILFPPKIPGQYGNLPFVPNFGNKVYALDPLLWWRMDEKGGTEVYDYGSLAAHGALTLGAGALDQAGPHPSMRSIQFDGSATKILSSAFTFTTAMGQEGTMLWWEKHPAAYWTDGANHRMRIFTNASNAIFSQKQSTNHLTTQYTGGGVNLFNDIAAPSTTTNWFMLALTWSLTNDQLILRQMSTAGAVLATDTDGSVPTYTGGSSQVYAGLAGSYLKDYISNLVILDTPLSLAVLQDLANVDGDY